MKNYCYICLLTACMAPMSLQAQKAIPYSGEVCVASLPTVPTTLPGISSDSYARRFADSEMLRFPKLISWIMANGSFSGIHKE